jgi:Domain of unknown function (DUF4340)
VEAAVKGTFLKTGLAALVLAGLGAYAYFIDAKKPAGDEKAKAKVFAFDKAKARELDLAPRDGEAIRLTREGETWHLMAPVTAPADASEADALVSTLEGLEIDEVVTESASNLADFGLAAPKHHVSLIVDGSKAPLELLVGDKAPGGGALYAKLPASPRVFTVASWLEGSFEKKAFDFRDRDLLHAKRDDVRTVEITGPEGNYALVRGVGDEWSFSKPVQSRAGRWSVDSLLGTLEGLRMEKIAADEAKDLKAFGLVNPARTVALALADGRTLRLEIGSSAAEKQYYAREAASKLVAVIPGAIVEDLAKGMGELRAKRLLDIATYDVEGIEAEIAGATRAWVRSTVKNNDIDVPKWKRTAPDTKEVETSAVQDALFKVGAVEATEFIDAPKGLGSYGLDKPAFRLALRFGKDKPATWLEIGRADGAAWARRPEDAAILKIDPAKADELQKAFETL